MQFIDPRELVEIAKQVIAELNIAQSRVIKTLGINRTTFYYKTKESESDAEEQEIVKYIKHILNSRDYYGDFLGTRKIANVLFTDFNIQITHNRVNRLINKHKILRKSKQCKKKTSPYYKANGNRKNLLNRQFNSATAPNQIWCADFTEIKAKEGSFQVFVILDLFSRKALCCEALPRATVDLMSKEFIKTCKKRVFDKNISPIFHSDNGSQFTSKEFIKILEDNNFQASFSAPYTSNDNACVESFNRYFKERLNLNTRQVQSLPISEIKRRISDYIEKYNNTTPHEANDFIYEGKVYKESPNKKEERFYQSKVRQD